MGSSPDAVRGRGAYRRDRCPEQTVCTTSSKGAASPWPSSMARGGTRGAGGSWSPDWRSASVCSPMTAAATREASGPLRREASTRTATTSPLCSRPSTWPRHTWRRTRGAATSPCGSRPGARTSSARSPAMSRRCGACSKAMPRPGGEPEVSMRSAGASPRATTRARHASSSRRSPSGPARGSASCRRRCGRSSSTTPRPSWASFGIPISSRSTPKRWRTWRSRSGSRRDPRARPCSGG
jgi:hypothetical protein